MENAGVNNRTGRACGKKDKRQVKIVKRSK